MAIFCSESGRCEAGFRRAAGLLHLRVKSMSKPINEIDCPYIPETSNGSSLGIFKPATYAGSIAGGAPARDARDRGPGSPGGDMRGVG